MTITNITVYYVLSITIEFPCICAGKVWVLLVG